MQKDFCIIKGSLLDLFRNFATKGMNPLAMAIKGINKGFQPQDIIENRVPEQVYCLLRLIFRPHIFHHIQDVFGYCLVRQRTGAEARIRALSAQRHHAI